MSVLDKMVSAKRRKEVRDIALDNHKLSLPQKFFELLELYSGLKEIPVDVVWNDINPKDQKNVATRFNLTAKNCLVTSSFNLVFKDEVKHKPPIVDARIGPIVEKLLFYIHGTPVTFANVVILAKDEEYTIKDVGFDFQRTLVALGCPMKSILQFHSEMIDHLKGDKKINMSKKAIKYCIAYGH